MFMTSPDVIHPVHFFDIGKKKAFKILLSNHGDFQDLPDLRNDSSVSAVTWMACVSFVGLLYGFM